MHWPQMPSPFTATIVHTTHLCQGKVRLDGASADGSVVVLPPAVLLPRVGTPRYDKVALYDQGPPILLSDCVVALRCCSSDHAIAVQTALVEHFSTLAGLYTGTGARYLTMKRLAAFLCHLGLDVHYDVR